MGFVKRGLFVLSPKGGWYGKNLLDLKKAVL